MCITRSITRQFGNTGQFHRPFLRQVCHLNGNVIERILREIRHLDITLQRYTLCDVLQQVGVPLYLQARHVDPAINIRSSQTVGAGTYIVTSASLLAEGVFSGKLSVGTECGRGLVAFCIIDHIDIHLLAFHRYARFCIAHLACEVYDISTSVVITLSTDVVQCTEGLYIDGHGIG